MNPYHLWANLLQKNNNKSDFLLLQFSIGAMILWK